MAKITDLPIHKRPREKLLEKGVAALSDVELLAILLRTGYKGKSAIDVARRILATTPLSDLVQLSTQDLAKIKGVGQSRATSLVAAFALASRAQSNALILDSPKVVATLVSDLKTLKQERFVMLCLNARNELIKRVEISVGTLTASLVHPREVFAPAIRYRAAGIILVHNHPSGSLEKSAEDIEITKRLVEVGNLLDIAVIDHLIVSSKGFVSFQQEGWV